ncbi:hypothetical protein L593_06160 [Salinarchaeum sp. Harcht-Bsk1]|uniref:DUF5809 family protein n=1 Tax=Salinarchaeum sp. Harcht-Bsk1 TaxID=1333523 RepID=UPI0003423CD9|nr:DUF5809 family protein [Salinarchaeum sp. Harcht-Bsk1]AGN01181.1 hypothetical protein L593_06160 [Salinarchaeum sp. Harcht-Bsk1]
METIGRLTPTDPEDARAAYEELATPASVVTKEVARALDVEDIQERVSPEVIVTARDAIFASTLAVTVGTREEFEAWRDEFDGEVFEAGNENVDSVVWHAFDGEGVAATFHEERDAAVATLRRQAFNRLYRDLFYPEA